MNQVDFEHLYEQEAAALFRFLAYRTGDRELAQDLTADAFERALRSRHRFDPRRGSRKTWLYAIALNLLRDHARRADAEARALARAPRPDRAGRDSEELVAGRDELGSALQRLAREEREVIALRFGADLAVAEIAAVLREKRTTVEGRLYRALAKLRATLSSEAPVP